MSDDILGEVTKLPLTNYTNKDRYHDFRKVFMGTDEGKRVLSEIVKWAKLLDAPKLTSPIDPYFLAIREGGHNLVRKLLVTIYKEPPEQPTQTNRNQNA